MNHSIFPKLLIATIFISFFSKGFCGSKGDDLFTVLSLYQKVTFEKKDGKLLAQLEVTEWIQCNSKTGELYRKAIYFDDESTIEEVEIDGRNQKYIVSNDLPHDGIFHNDTKMAYFDYNFGTSTKRPLELKYTKKYLDFKFIDILRFVNNKYATNESNIEIVIPSWLDCRIKEFNFENNNVVKSKKVEDGDTLYIYTKKNIAAEGEFKSKPDFRKYEPHMLLLPYHMTIDKKQVDLLPSIDKLYAWYSSLAAQIGNDTKEVEAKAKELTAGLTTDEEKIKAIFYFVQDNIKYIAFEAGIMGFKPESCQNVYQKKFGDCKGMANLAKTMLVALGYDARLTWLGTHDIPYDYSFPSMYVDNHMICTVLLNGKQIFIDPTESESDLNVYADRIQGREVLIEDGPKYIKSKVPLQDSSMHRFIQNVQLKLDGTELIGEAREQMMGNSKTRFSNFIKAISKKDKLDALKYYISQNDKNITVTSTQDDIHPEHDKAFNLNYKMAVSNQIVKVGKEKYVNIEFEQPLLSIEIEEGRNCAYDLDRKINASYTTTLSIPANHKVTYLPSAIELSNSDWQVKLSYELEGDKVIYKKSVHSKTTEISKDKLGEWKAFSTKLKAFYEDRLVLEEQ